MLGIVLLTLFVGLALDLAVYSIGLYIGTGSSLQHSTYWISIVLLGAYSRNISARYRYWLHVGYAYGHYVYDGCN